MLSAAEAVRRDEGPRSLKEAVLHLGNGIELLIKARLAREHWALVFSNADQASYDKLADAEFVFVSVDFLKAITRLGQIANVSVDKTTISHIESIRKLRNRLTHYTATLDSAQTKSLVAKAMAFCVEFCEQQGMVTADTRDKLGEIHINLAELQDFVADRMKAISAEWKYALIWECDECLQDALVIDGGEADCKFCKREYNPWELAVKHSEGSVEDCPECGEESTFAYITHNEGSAGWVCFSCGIEGEEYDHCWRCDRVSTFSEGEELKFCGTCWMDMLGRD